MPNVYSPTNRTFQQKKQNWIDLNRGDKFTIIVEDLNLFIDPTIRQKTTKNMENWKIKLTDEMRSKYR